MYTNKLISNQNNCNNAVTKVIRYKFSTFGSPKRPPREDDPNCPGWLYTRTISPVHYLYCTHVPSVLYIIYTVHKCHQSCTFFILNTSAIIPVHFLYCTKYHQSCTLFVLYTRTISPVQFIYCNVYPYHQSCTI